MQDWEKQYNLSLKVVDKALANDLLNKLQHDISKNDESDWNWFLEALADPKKKYFAAAVLTRASIPKILFHPMLQAAIDENNPSLNRNFLIPCISTYGQKKVTDYLMDVSRNGTEIGKQGVDRLMYWIDYPNVTKSGTWDTESE